MILLIQSSVEKKERYNFSFNKLFGLFNLANWSSLIFLGRWCLCCIIIEWNSSNWNNSRKHSRMTKFKWNTTRSQQSGSSCFICCNLLNEQVFFFLFSSNFSSTRFGARPQTSHLAESRNLNPLNKQIIVVESIIFADEWGKRGVNILIKIMG